VSTKVLPRKCIIDNTLYLDICLGYLSTSCQDLFLFFHDLRSRHMWHSQEPRGDRLTRLFHQLDQSSCNPEVLFIQQGDGLSSCSSTTSSSHSMRVGIDAKCVAPTVERWPNTGHFDAVYLSVATVRCESTVVQPRSIRRPASSMTRNCKFRKDKFRSSVNCNIRPGVPTTILADDDSDDICFASHTDMSLVCLLN
jgi:hypothetical protein